MARWNSGAVMLAAALSLAPPPAWSQATGFGNAPARPQPAPMAPRPPVDAPVVRPAPPAPAPVAPPIAVSPPVAPPPPAAAATPPAPVPPAVAAAPRIVPPAPAPFAVEASATGFTVRN